MENKCESCSWGEIIKNSGEAVKNALTHKGKLVLEELQIKNRLDICSGCEYFTGARCKACGCFVKLKAALASESCPYNKWEPV